MIQMTNRHENVCLMDMQMPLTVLQDGKVSSFFSDVIFSQLFITREAHLFRLSKTSLFSEASKIVSRMILSIFP